MEWGQPGVGKFGTVRRRGSQVTQFVTQKRSIERDTMEIS